ncbi:MAG TPA: hypothetical protein VMM38_13535 [Aridibacter sp.]|nr:hypothetical protein [Aridibacter sp.]
MRDLIFILAIVGMWLLLQLVILPRLGIGTGLRGACGAGSRRYNRRDEEPGQD